MLGPAMKIVHTFLFFRIPSYLYGVYLMTYALWIVQNQNLML